jgi:hypothetical protein
MCLLVLPALAWGQSEMVTGKATPGEVYRKVAEAARFLAREKENGLGEFQNPQGRFVWKDTFVWVTECEKNYCLPTPQVRNLGLELSQRKCHQTGKLYVLSLCDAVAAKPDGVWAEYWLPRPGFNAPQRKVGFMMQVPGMPHQVIAEIFDDSTTLEQLQRISSGN